MPDRPPTDPAEHAEKFAHRYARDLDVYCAIKMEELGIPERMHGARDLEGDGRWTAFIACDRQGGSLLEGIAVNSGCLNPEILKWKQAARIFASPGCVTGSTQSSPTSTKRTGWAATRRR